MLDAHFLRDLYRHQADALCHLLLNSVVNYVLAWEMGTGKTAVAVRYGAALPATGAQLYCCPASCKEQVAREIRCFAPGARVQILNGRQAKLEPGVDWYVVNYELLLSDEVFAQLINRRWPLLVLDESHLLRSPTAKRTRRVFGRAPCLAGQADHVLALTGTPVVNSLLDFFPMTNRLFPRAIAVEDANGTLRRMQLVEFEEKYCVRRLVHVGGGRTIERIGGGKNLAELRERLSPYVSRLRRDEVLDLPPIAINDYALTVETGDALAGAMAALPRGLVEALQRADDDSLLHLLQRHAAELATLRRLLGTLKAGAAAEHILQRLDRGEDRVIAFFHHRDVGDVVLEQLHTTHIAAAMIRGDTPAGARTRAIDALTDGNLQVLLLQNQSGSLGLNLQACRRAIIIEPDWTHAATEQAIGRIYRAGQTRNCIVEFLLLADSLDEHIVGVARRKAALAANLIEKEIA